MSTVVLDNWRSDQITSFYAQIALKLLHLPFVINIILDVFFSDLGRIGSLKKKKNCWTKTRKTKQNEHDAEARHLLASA